VGGGRLGVAARFLQVAEGVLAGPLEGQGQCEHHHQQADQGLALKGWQQFMGEGRGR